jgi:hypothetical protein
LNLKTSEILIIINSLASSLFVYFLLSEILVTQTITIPVSILMFALILGLTRYYSKSNSSKIEIGTRVSAPETTHRKSQHTVQANNFTVSTMLFPVIFAILIAVSILSFNMNSTIFIPWSSVDVIGFIHLAVAISISFFFPGYALILIAGNFRKIDPILRILIAYLSSVLITGLTVYLSSSNPDFGPSDIKNSMIIVNLAILIAFLLFYRVNIIGYTSNIQCAYRFLPDLITKILNGLKTNSSQMLVFASLLGLLLVSTTYLYGGITIGDQWFHQGRALLFMSGSFTRSVNSGQESSYPPFQSAVLAGVTSISGVPLVNTYASIAFLNFTPIIATYYFFSQWFPKDLKRAALLACSLFAIGSGFNWLYLIEPMAQPILSDHSFLETIYRAASVVVVQPTSFIFAANPDFSTGLIYIALTAGFVLLGLIHERIASKFIYTILVTGISIVGALTHPEFYYFILVGSILPVIFGLHKCVNYMYFGLLMALTFVYIFDIFFPGNASIEMFGLPLVLMIIFFVLCTWAAFSLRQILNLSSIKERFSFNRILPNLPRTKIQRRFSILIRMLVLSVVAFIYVLGVITTTQSSTEDLKIQTTNYRVPWFFYPIKLGIIGCLGLIFILSYLFRRFEKEIFVFGVIILVAILTGPYYDEHRFSKFIMVGMIGFASLLVYKILNLRCYKKELVNTLIIPTIIICTSISVLLFIGYNSLVVQTHDYSHNPKKNFPSISEIGLFDILRSKLDANSSKFNIVSLPDQYKQGNLITRIQAFSGFPYEKIYGNPATLNSSTLDSFYRLLESSDAKYIITPKSKNIEGPVLSYPAHFALDHFPITYVDDNYTVREVPPLAAPSSFITPQVALVYERELGSIPSEILNRTSLSYNNENFNLKDKTQFINITKDSPTERIILYGNERNEGVTIWSKDSKLDDGINYAKVKFRIISENEGENSDAGLQWKEGGVQYYASIFKKGLKVTQKQINNENSTKIEYQNPSIDKKGGIFYTLSIQSLKNSINIYVDGMLKIQIPRTITAKNLQGLSNIGISSFHNTAEFGLLEVGNGEINYDKYFYPHATLALSRVDYDTYLDGDPSALSSSVTVLPFDPINWNDSTLKNYLAYVNEGGRLIIIDSDNTSDGMFSKLFSIESKLNQTVGFSNILEKKNNHTLFRSSGMVNPIYLRPSSDIDIIASYMNESNQAVAPFAIEKHFPNAGSIIFVNAKGYFDQISKSPRKNFLALANLSNLLKINSSRTETTESSEASPLRYIGDLQLTGDIILKTSSAFFGNENNENDSSIFADKMVTFYHNQTHHNIFHNVSLKGLSFGAPSEISITYKGKLLIPDTGSYNSYFGMSIPNGFNATLRVLPNKLTPSSQILNISNLSLPIKNISTISFYNVTSDSQKLKLIPVLLKSPEISVAGVSTFKSADIDGQLPYSTSPLNFTGFMSAKLDFIDNYYQANSHGTKVLYITYLKEINFNRLQEPK